MGSSAKYFRPVCPPDCPHPNNGRHHHRGQFEAYWQSLTAKEQQSLRDKANWEHITLSAVAREWGAIND
jgi:hypothetical protein